MEALSSITSLMVRFTLMVEAVSTKIHKKEREQPVGCSLSLSVYKHVNERIRFVWEYISVLYFYKMD